MSTPHVTICYLTNRRNPRIHWFLDSLGRQMQERLTPIKLVVVDFYAKERSVEWQRDVCSRAPLGWVHTPPMPSVWQGPHRLTTRDYFAASNARNTGLCFADDGYIVYVDDLSVLLPGWLDSVLAAAREGCVACGAYAKVPRLIVENGLVTSFADISNPCLASIESLCMSVWPVGFDTRWRFAPANSTDPYPCGGSWMFGCSCGMPVEALLTIGGWDHRLDSMGSEDYSCGIMLEKAGYPVRYCKRMMTLESEEAHGEDPPFLRVIKGPPNDTSNASHVALRWVILDSHPTVPDIYGNGGIRALRQRTLAGEPFPVIGNPRHHWFDGQALSEM